MNWTGPTHICACLVLTLCSDAHGDLLQKTAVQTAVCFFSLKKGEACNWSAGYIILPLPTPKPTPTPRTQSQLTHTHALVGLLLVS